MSEEKIVKKDELEGKPSVDDKYLYRRDKNKTLRQIARETHDRIEAQRILDAKKEASEAAAAPIGQVGGAAPDASKETPAEKTPEQKAAEEKAAADAKAKQDIADEEKRQEELAKRAAKEAAEEVAREFRQEFQTKISEIVNKDADIQAKQKEADDLIASWEKEKRLPKDYREVIDETLRINQEALDRQLKTAREKQAADAAAAAKKARDDQTKAAEDRKAAADKQLSDYQTQIKNDLQKLYDGKYMKVPKNPEEINNEHTTDPDAQATQKLFEFGRNLNIKRKEEKLAPVLSLTDIYFFHYKPYLDAQGKKARDNQPAGEKAPIGGSRGVTPSENKEEKAYVYARDHGKSFEQLKAEAIRRMKKTLQTLGK